MPPRLLLRLTTRRPSWERSTPSTIAEAHGSGSSGSDARPFADVCLSWASHATVARPPEPVTRSYQSASSRFPRSRSAPSTTETAATTTRTRSRRPVSTRQPGGCQIAPPGALPLVTDGKYVAWGAVNRDEVACQSLADQADA